MTIEFDKINQLIIIKKPDVEIVCQDLINAIRDYEDDLLSFDVAKIANANGKDDLGGGVLVGITLTLLNWRLQFEARTELEGWTICKVSGGNLVAVDENGDGMYQIAPSAYVNVILANSSSATLQELTSIQYSSFNGGVTIDVLNGISGTIYPIGTPLFPVNNYEEAMIIAELRGFNKFFVKGELTINTDCINCQYIGDGHDSAIITVDGGEHVTTSFTNLTLSGTFDDGSNIMATHCKLQNLYKVTIDAHDSILIGELKLNDSESSYFFNCNDGLPGTDLPTININNCESLGFFNYSGGLKLINMNIATEITINLSSGRVILDETCNTGNIIVRGIGTFENNSHIPVENINIIGLLNLNSITSSVWAANKNDLTTPNSIGQYIANKLLSVSKFLGLK